MHHHVKREASVAVVYAVQYSTKIRFQIDYDVHTLSNYLAQLNYF